MAAATREATPPPIIGKAGRYTVFITPPPAPKTPSPARTPPSPKTPFPCDVSPSPTLSSSPPSSAVKPPPVQVPPPQFECNKFSSDSGSVFGFFWDALAKVQDAHSRLDECLARWLGLNESKYQWALNDYLESKPSDVETGKTKDIMAKGQNV